jgi:type VI secretion system protein ImpE
MTDEGHNTTFSSMGDSMTSHEFYQQGKLREAVGAALDDVKLHPADASKRGFLAELLCFAGAFERADRQLDAVSAQDADAAMEAHQFRHLIRAEQARQQFYIAGRMPEFLKQDITPDLKLHMEAAVLLRAGQTAEAVRLLGEAREQRSKLAGTCDGKAFEDICDLDDLTSSFFEVLTAMGDYYWVPMDRVESIEFAPPTRPRDLLWRRAHLTVRDIPDADVYFPVLYAGSAADATESIRLGRATEWRGENGAPIRGAGQRVFLVGDEDRSILELKKLAIGNSFS